VTILQPRTDSHRNTHILGPRDVACYMSDTMHHAFGLVG
jgi:hypothetical protein